MPRTSSSLVAFALIIAPLMGSAQTFPSRHVAGVILSVDRTTVMLRSHRAVFLKHGTQIEPRGQKLSPGQRIVVQGDDAANGNLDARAIRIIGASEKATVYGSWYGGSDDITVARPVVPRTAARRRPATPVPRHQAQR